MSNKCPECDHVFQGNGWDGIDAHWRAHHEKFVMPYEQAWPMIKAGHYSRDSIDDPEASYRRGYQQGAFDALRFSSTSTVDKIRNWVDEKLTHWRYVDRVTQRHVKPPVP